MLSIQCLSLQICPCLAIYPGHQAVSSVSVLPFDFRFFSSSAEHLQDLLELRQFSLFSCTSSSILTDCFIYIYRGYSPVESPPAPPSRCLQIPITSCYSSNLGVGTPGFSSPKSTPSPSSPATLSHLCEQSLYPTLLRRSIQGYRLCLVGSLSWRKGSVMHSKVKALVICAARAGEAHCVA